MRNVIIYKEGEERIPDLPLYEDNYTDVEKHSVKVLSNGKLYSIENQLISIEVYRKSLIFTDIYCNNQFIENSFNYEEYVEFAKKHLYGRMLDSFLKSPSKSELEFQYFDQTCKGLRLLLLLMRHTKKKETFVLNLQEKQIQIESHENDAFCINYGDIKKLPYSIIQEKDVFYIQENNYKELFLRKDIDPFRVGNITRIGLHTFEPYGKDEYVVLYGNAKGLTFIKDDKQRLIVEYDLGKRDITTELESLLDRGPGYSRNTIEMLFSAIRDDIRSRTWHRRPYIDYSINLDELNCNYDYLL